MARKKTHPFGRSWRAEMGQQAKPLTPEQYAAWKAQWLIDEAARKAGYAAAQRAERVRANIAEIEAKRIERWRKRLAAK